MREAPLARMSKHRLEEIRERDATREVGALYADIRRCMRLPLVNLIYRHLATLPGALPEVWTLVRTMILSGQLEPALNRLERELPVLEVDDFGPAGGAETQCEDQRSIMRVLQAYNRGNGLNLIALAAVLRLARDRTRDLVRISQDPPSYEGIPLPALVRIDDLDAELFRKVTSIALLHGGGPGVVPSLYLHLANWPNALSAACDSLTPRLKDGSVDRHRKAAVGLAEAEAERILAALAIAGHGPQIPEQALTALESFVAHLIPEMLPIGIALEASLMPKPSS